VTLSPAAKKTWHTFVVACVSGPLSYLAGTFSTGHVPGLKILAVGVLTAAGSRVAGWALAKVETT